MAEGLNNGLAAQPPETEAVPNQPVLSQTPVERAGLQRWQAISDYISGLREIGAIFGFGKTTAADRRFTNQGRMGVMVGGPGPGFGPEPGPRNPNINQNGRRVFFRPDQRRQDRGGPRLPDTPYNRREQLVGTSEAPMTEEQVRAMLSTLNINGTPVLFNAPVREALDISSAQSVLSFMRKSNIPPTRYQFIVSNLQRAASQLGAALQSRPEFQGATFTCDGTRVWATVNGRSAFATGSQVMFVDGPPRLPNRGGVGVVTDGGVRMNWTLNAGGGNTYTGNGRSIHERLSTGSTTFDVPGAAGYLSPNGVYIVRVNNPQAMLPNPRALAGAPGVNPTRAGSEGIFLHMPDRSRLPAEYRSIVEQNGGWLPPPMVLLRAGNQQEAARKEQILMQFASSLDLETSNAWLTGVFANTAEGVGWSLRVSNLRFDPNRGTYRGVDGLRAGRGGCMQMADLGVHILRNRGYNAVSMILEKDHAGAVALQPVAGGYQLIVYDSNGVSYRRTQPTPVAALLQAWQDDHNPRPAQAQFIDDQMNTGYISYEALAQRMVGGAGQNRGPSRA